MGLKQIGTLPSIRLPLLKIEHLSPILATTTEKVSCIPQIDYNEHTGKISLNNLTHADTDITITAIASSSSKTTNSKSYTTPIEWTPSEKEVAFKCPSIPGSSLLSKNGDILYKNGNWQYFLGPYDQAKKLQCADSTNEVKACIGNPDTTYPVAICKYGDKILQAAGYLLKGACTTSENKFIGTQYQMK